MKLQEVTLQQEPEEVSYTIFCDLDGVLADFKKEMRKILKSPVESQQYSDDLYAKDPAFRKRMWKTVADYQKDNGPTLWRHLELLPDAMQLWNFIKDKNVQILTATGDSKYGSAAQKRAWVTEHFGSAVRCNFVKSAPLKAEYAGSHHILIDDQARATQPFIQAGGIGIVHTSAASTIAKLKELGV